MIMPYCIWPDSFLSHTSHSNTALCQNVSRNLAVQPRLSPQKITIMWLYCQTLTTHRFVKSRQTPSYLQSTHEQAEYIIVYYRGITVNFNEQNRCQSNKMLQPKFRLIRNSSSRSDLTNKALFVSSRIRTVFQALTNFPDIFILIITSRMLQ